MVTYNDWSQLITINYRSGAGGDFLSILLDKNFNSDVGYTKTSDYRYSYKNCPFFQKIKTLSLIYYYLTDTDNIIVKLCPAKMVQHAEQLYNTYLNSNFSVEESLRQYCYDCYSCEFNNNKRRVTNIHNFKTNFLNICDLQLLFPKSYNINLYTKNKIYTHILEYIIFPWKIVNKNNKNKKCFHVSEIVVRDEEIQDNHNGLHIDPFDLIMLGKNYNDILSEFLGEKIILDKQMLQTYKNELIEICNVCDIDPLKDYDLNVITEKAIKIFNDRFENE